MPPGEVWFPNRPMTQQAGGEDRASPNDQRNHCSHRLAGTTREPLPVTGDAQRRPRGHGARLALLGISL